MIAEGGGTFTLDGDTRQVFAGDVLFIPTGGIHRIENGSVKKLVIIETQLGLCLEDDIIRLEDDWGRA